MKKITNKIVSLKRSCPICEGNMAECLCSIRFSPVDNENLPDEFDVVCCKNCGFIFDDMHSSQKDFDKYYENTTKYQAIGACGSGGSSRDDLIRYASLYNFAFENISPLVKVLDIGAGKCGFLQYLSSKGFINLTAIEPSIEENNINNIKIYHAISDIGREKEEFDFIICSQVMEHIFDINAFMVDMLSLSNYKTKFYIEVPDANEYLNSYRAPFHLFDREHINHFNLTSLRNIFAKFNLVAFKEYKSKYVYNSIGCLFEYGDIVEVINDTAGKYNILKYITVSEKADNISHLKDAKEPIIVWGLGAYFRRIYLKDDFPKNIAAIIDRDQGKSGKFWNNIPITTCDILKEKIYKNCTLIVTSALYKDEIKKEITEMNFKGTVLTAF